MSQSNSTSWRIAAAIGVIAGLASGLLGVGGGFLIVPLQVIWLGAGQRRAGGTSLAAIFPIALVGVAVYAFGTSRPQIDLPVAIALSIGSGAGALIGAHMARRVPENALRMVVAVLLFAVGIKEIHDAALGGAYSLTGAGGAFDGWHYLAIGLCGLVIGIESGLTGVGGGVFLVPTMVLGFGIAQHVAQGTSLLVILPTVAIGALTHYRHGNVDLRTAGLVAGAGVPMALLGPKPGPAPSQPSTAWFVRSFSALRGQAPVAAARQAVDQRRGKQQRARRELTTCRVDTV